MEILSCILIFLGWIATITILAYMAIEDIKNLRWLWTIISMALLIGGLWLLIVTEKTQKKEEMQACKNINGSYVVVEEDYVMVGKVLTKIDVYGCVVK